MLESSGVATADKSGGGGEVGGSSGGLMSEEEGVRIEETSERNSGGGGGGNRWPRQETVALLQIRSVMDTAFRDSSLKAPLWEEVSRKLAELGYHRSAKKCKEKFENVYKYHKRTKEGRSSKSDGKTYRFFDQLEALENQPPPILLPPVQTKPQTIGGILTMPHTNIPPIVSQVTIPLPTNPTNSLPSNTSPPPPPPPPPPPLQPPSITTTTTTTNAAIQLPHLKVPSNLPTFSTSSSSSSSTSSDEEPERRRKRKRKRKWESPFQRAMKEVIQKQEEMQKKFLETLERRERDRLAREEAWRAQETARMNRQHEILSHERSMAAAKDAAVMAFLQKVSHHHQIIPNLPHQMQIQQPNNPIPALAPAPAPASAPAPAPPQPPIRPRDNGGGGGNSFLSTSSSRWPKAEIEALIKLRTDLDLKYQENGPKGPLWEEISAGMGRLGYNRNPKRCKEKWENINKYFKKVKESNKKRPEDSKTCPYFHQLDALYREKTKNTNNTNTNNSNSLSTNDPTMVVPIMVQPERQWPLSQEQPNEEREGDGDDDDDDNEVEEEDEEEEAGNYEVVANKGASVGGVE